MIIIQIDPSELPAMSLAAIAERSLEEAGDYEMLYEQQMLFTTLRWGAILLEDGDNRRVAVMMDVFSTEDGEPCCEPIIRHDLPGVWTIPGFANIGVLPMEVLVKVL
jgi:hypothetical protein